MIEGIRLKVCGLTSQEDAEAAAQNGADYLGFIIYPKSPRFISLENYTALSSRLPAIKKVAVCVEPTTAELIALQRAGFDYFQIHFKHVVPVAVIAEWSRLVTSDKLWLAPKLPQNEPFNLAWLSYTKTVLCDTYHTEGFGGSGQTGDWKTFMQLRIEHPHIQWILAGGLSPTNITEALRATAARNVDVNSGIESAPGVKDHELLKSFIQAMKKK
jgi:phosphoribosylanthranilate isomerase